MAAVELAATSPLLRMQLSQRLRMRAPAEWEEFSRLWMAFNAMYGGEPDLRERSRVMACIRRNMNESASRRVLSQAKSHIDRIVAIPPGDLRLNRWDPKFRAASQRCVGLYRDRSGTAISRLAGVAGVLYQVRYNTIHGSKDPDSERDHMVVKESVGVLNSLLPELEDSLARLATSTH